MEGFLSLPRFAKGGIAVLLAVALLGWAIVAYSAKRQHEDARSRDSAMTTLKGQADREQQALAELESIKEQFAAAEAELVSTREAVTAGREEKGELDARIAELEAEIAAAIEAAETASEDSQALSLAAPTDNDEEAPSDAEQPTLVDSETLRTRLTETMTALSAKNATLQQRERELVSAQSDMEAALAEIETLKSAVSERDDLRARLTQNMTVLSARTATVQQKERELAKLKADHEEALVTLASLEASSAEQDEAGRSLDALTAKLAETQQELDDGASVIDQNQSDLAAQQARLQALGDEQATIEAVIAEKQAEVDELEQKLASLASDVSNEEDALAAKSSSLTAEIDSLEAALSGKEDAIAEAEAELSRLEGEIAAAQEELLAKEKEIAATQEQLLAKEGEIATAQKLLLVKEGEIATAQELLLVKEGEVEEKHTLLTAQTTEIESAEASLAALKDDQAEVEAETEELRSAIDRQQAALDDLDVLKGKLDETGEALARQTALLAERQGELAAADTELNEIRQASASDPNVDQSLPTIPIAELSKDSLAVLPIDPLYNPFPIQTPKGIRLTQIHFDLASAELTPGGLRKAKEAAAWIKERNVEKIQLVGFTDSIGTKENNKALADRRARSLLKLLEAEGVDGSRIEIIANGEDGVQELIPDHTAEPLNRCVGIFISTGS